MSRAYNVIDADGHILEPFDLWNKYTDPKYRDRAPRLVEDEIGKRRLITQMKTLPGVWFPSCEEVARWCLDKFPPRAHAA